jgi:hypothetical protein
MAEVGHGLERDARLRELALGVLDAGVVQRLASTRVLQFCRRHIKCSKRNVVLSDLPEVILQEIREPVELHRSRYNVHSRSYSSRNATPKDQLPSPVGAVGKYSPQPCVAEALTTCVSGGVGTQR